MRSHHSKARSKSRTAVHAETRKQQVQALEIGIVASPASAVVVASSRQRIPASTSACATSAAPSSPSPSISRSGTANRRPMSAASTASFRARFVSPPSVRDVALVEGEPAVVGAVLERLEQASSPLEPAARDRGGAVKVELVGSQPRRHPSRSGGVSGLPVGAIRALARGEHGRRRRRATRPPSSGLRATPPSLRPPRTLRAPPPSDPRAALPSRARSTWSYCALVLAFCASVRRLLRLQETLQMSR